LDQLPSPELAGSVARVEWRRVIVPVTRRRLITQEDSRGSRSPL
jgi:hypothetical protein